MPIPPLDPDGYLPPGVHDCTLDEIQSRFGRFQQTDQRPRLWEKLLQYVTALRSGGVARALVVNGSFVTGRPRPSDIDLIVVIPPDFHLAVELSPRAANSLSSNWVRMRFGFDLFVARADAGEYSDYVQFFQKVKEQPGRQKGVLRVAL